MYQLIFQVSADFQGISWFSDYHIKVADGNGRQPAISSKSQTSPTSWFSRYQLIGHKSWGKVAKKAASGGRWKWAPTYNQLKILDFTCQLICPGISWLSVYQQIHVLADIKTNLMQISTQTSAISRSKMCHLKNAQSWSSSMRCHYLFVVLHLKRVICTVKPSTANRRSAFHWVDALLQQKEGSEMQGTWSLAVSSSRGRSWYR